MSKLKFTERDTELAETEERYEKAQKIIAVVCFAVGNLTGLLGTLLYQSRF